MHFQKYLTALLASWLIVVTTVPIIVVFIGLVPSRSGGREREALWGAWGASRIHGCLEVAK